MNKSTNETIHERDRVKTTDIMNLRYGEFYGFITEDDEKENIKSRFQINENLEDSDFDFPIKVTDFIFMKITQRLLWQAKSIFETHEEDGGGMIKL